MTVITSKAARMAQTTGRTSAIEVLLVGLSEAESSIVRNDVTRSVTSCDTPPIMNKAGSADLMPRKNDPTGPISQMDDFSGAAIE